MISIDLQTLKQIWEKTHDENDRERFDAECFRTGEVQKMTRTGVYSTLLKNAPPILVNAFHRDYTSNQVEFPYTKMKDKYGNTYLWELILAQEERPIGFYSRKELQSVEQNERDLIRSIDVFSFTRDLKVLRKFPHLRHLKISSPTHHDQVQKIGPVDSTLSDLVDVMNELKTLDVSYQDITNHGLHLISQFPTLETLKINNLIEGNITQEMMNQISLMTKIKKLEMEENELPKNFVKLLASMPNLEEVSLTIGLTEENVHHLTRMPNLKTLKLSRGFISEPTLELLKYALPDLEIMIDPPEQMG